MRPYVEVPRELLAEALRRLDWGELPPDGLDEPVWEVWRHGEIRAACSRERNSFSLGFLWDDCECSVCECSPYHDLLGEIARILLEEELARLQELPVEA